MIGTSFHEAEEGQIVIARQQDVDPILKANAQKQIAGEVGSADMKHAASIPMVVIEDYCNKAGITFQQWMQDPSHVKRMLSDPDLSMFRIWKGAV